MYIYIYIYIVVLCMHMFTSNTQTANNTPRPRVQADMARGLLASCHSQSGLRACSRLCRVGPISLRREGSFRRAYCADKDLCQISIRSVRSLSVYLSGDGLCQISLRREGALLSAAWSSRPSIRKLRNLASRKRRRKGTTDHAANAARCPQRKPHLPTKIIPTKILRLR